MATSTRVGPWDNLVSQIESLVPTDRAIVERHFERARAAWGLPKMKMYKGKQAKIERRLMDNAMALSLRLGYQHWYSKKYVEDDGEFVGVLAQINVPVTHLYGHHVKKTTDGKFVLYPADKWDA